LPAKADKVADATLNNFAGLDANGNLKDSGKKASDFIASTEKGTYNGVATLSQFGRVVEAAQTAYDYADNGTIDIALNAKADLVDGKIPAIQLPSYVDDVAECANTSAFPATGETGKIYVALDTNLTYRWSGSTYAEISPSLALGETSASAYRGDRGKTAYEHSQVITGNPHGSTTADIAESTNKNYVTDTQKDYLNNLGFFKLSGSVSLNNVTITNGYSEGIYFIDNITESVLYSYPNDYNVTAISCYLMLYATAKQVLYIDNRVYTRYKLMNSWSIWENKTALNHQFLEGLSTETSSDISEYDTVLSAFGKLQAQATLKLAKAPNVTSIDDVGIADDEIAIFDLTNKKIKTSNIKVSTTVGNDNTTIPTSKAVKDFTHAHIHPNLTPLSMLNSEEYGWHFTAQNNYFSDDLFYASETINAILIIAQGTAYGDMIAFISNYAITGQAVAILTASYDGALEEWIVPEQRIGEISISGITTNNTGIATLDSYYFIPNGTSGIKQLLVSGGASMIVGVDKGASSQTGDLRQFQNSVGGVLSAVDKDGFFRMDLSPVYTDIDFPVIIRTTGTNIPTLATMQGNIKAPQWAVNDIADLEQKEFPHSWKEASAVQWHIHLVTGGTDTADRYVKFQIEYCWANSNGTLSSVTTISEELLIPANTAAKTHKIYNIGSAWTPASGKIGGHIFARLTRIAATGTAPTTNPFVGMAQLHIINDTLGSRQITTK
jgi:hypothetical protein